MGNNQPNQTKPPVIDWKTFQQQFSIKYKYQGQAKNPRYGGGKLFQNKDSGLFVVEKQVLIPVSKDSANIIAQWEMCFHVYRDIEHSNLVRYMGHTGNDAKPMCGGNFYSLTCYFEYLPQNLNEDVLVRSQTGRYYKEVHLWYVLYHVVLPGAYLNSKNRRLGDVGLAQILINESADIKILPQGAFLNDLNLSQRYAKGQLKYIHPQTADTIKNGLPVDLNQMKQNDVYSLGVMMLELMSLQPFPNKELVSEQKKNDILSSGNYSNQFLKLVAQLLLPYDTRPTFEELLQVLQLYQTEILSFQPFTMTQQHPQIQQSPTYNLLVAPLPIANSVYRPVTGPQLISPVNLSINMGFRAPQNLSRRSSNVNPAAVNTSMIASRNRTASTAQLPLSPSRNALLMNRKQISEDEFESRFQTLMRPSNPPQSRK